MLEFESVTFRNFMAYGDYDTTLDLTDLGQCLILGEVVDEEAEAVSDTSTIVDRSVYRSNGAGKSTIPNAIMWCIFGRTMHSSSPGDNIVNYFTGNNCVVTVRFKNGSYITRTRNTDGKNELIYNDGNMEQQFVGSTLSVSKLQQAELAKKFKLDWDLFCGAAFFAQYNKPWMEMADQVRKKAIERLLHIDRFSYYAKAAKERVTTFENNSVLARSKFDNNIKLIDSLNSQLSRTVSSSLTHADNQAKRIEDIQLQIIDLKTKHDAIELPNLDKLAARWEIIKQVRSKIDQMNRELNGLIREDTTIDANLKSCNNRIKLWQSKAGKICVECEQTIDVAHVDINKLSPIKAEIANFQSNKTTITKKIEEKRTAIANAEALVKQKQPTQTLEEAKSPYMKQKMLANEITNLEKSLSAIRNESNPYEAAIDEIKSRIAKIEEEQTSLTLTLERTNFVVQHCNYIYKAYNDRTKIKSYLFDEYIPFINDRLKYYLDLFGLDIQIRLTNSLGIASSFAGHDGGWSYEYQSGGERRRTDIALMFAMFDLHEHIYGRQSNVLVLDEVDGRLDDNGVETLVNIIKTELAHRAESIMVISHKNLMRDTFPREIRVRRVNRYAMIEHAFLNED